MKRVVMFSGGIGSYATARRVFETHGPTGLVLLFADTLIEDEDLYRFLEESAASLGVPLVKLAEGRDPWQVFFDERFLGNSRIDPCSKLLKRRFLRRWLEANCDPADTTVYLGIDWSEMHRMERAAQQWAPWRAEAPLCEKPYQVRADHLAALKADGIRPPRMYAMGFPHNNCGGFCIKAGQAQFRRLLLSFPDRYAYHEGREQELRAYLGKDVAILRDWSAGGKPLTLREFRERLQSGQQCDLLEWGGCGCFDGEEVA